MRGARRNQIRRSLFPHRDLPNGSPSGLLRGSLAAEAGGSCRRAGTDLAGAQCRLGPYCTINTGTLPSA